MQLLASKVNAFQPAEALLRSGTRLQKKSGLLEWSLTRSDTVRYNGRAVAFRAKCTGSNIWNFACTCTDHQYSDPDGGWPLPRFPYQLTKSCFVHQVFVSNFKGHVLRVLILLPPPCEAGKGKQCAQFWQIDAGNTFHQGPETSPPNLLPTAFLCARKQPLK
jgi:hypothetical protein